MGAPRTRAWQNGAGEREGRGEGRARGAVGPRPDRARAGEVVAASGRAPRAAFAITWIGEGCAACRGGALCAGAEGGERGEAHAAIQPLADPETGGMPESGWSEERGQGG